MNQPTVLGIVSYPVFPAKMGGQKCVEGFYRQLATQTKVVLAVATNNVTHTIAGADVHNFLFDHWKGPLNIFRILRLIRLIRNNKVDVIILEHSYFGWLGMLLRLLTSRPFIIRSHNIEAYRFRDMQRPFWKWYYLYEKYVHRKADHNFFITQEDLIYAQERWKLKKERCTLISYGMTGHQTMEYSKTILRRRIIDYFNIPQNTVLFLFNGSLDYWPNIDALQIIIHELLPRLRNTRILFRVFICGSGLSESWEKVLKAYPEIIVCGYVDDISVFMIGTDCSINPVTLGGGIKTKIVEALSCHQTVITTTTGARGLAPAITGDKMKVIPDYHWELFANAMSNINIYHQSATPELFFEQHSWKFIVERALVSLSRL